MIQFLGNHPNIGDEVGHHATGYRSIWTHNAVAYFESLVDDNFIDFVKERSIIQFSNSNTTVSSGVGIFLLPPLVLYVDASKNNTLIFVEYWKTAVRSTINNIVH